MAEDSDAGDASIEPVINAVQVRMAATFVSEEAPKIHPTFGGSPSFDPISQRFRSPLQTLAVALRDYVPAAFRIDVGPNTPKVEWDGLFDKINEVEEKAHGTDHGPRAVFRKLALKIGEYKEVIDPWISLIPNEYGLAVVKCAVAIVLNVAERENEKREKLFDALIEIRETIGEANSKTKSFQLEPEISRCAGLLYEAIVTAIQEILESLPRKAPTKSKDASGPTLSDAILRRQIIIKDTGHRLISRWRKGKDDESTATENSDSGTGGMEKKGEKETRKQKRKNIDLDAILENARTAAKDLDRAVDEWKTETMIRTGEYSKDTNARVAVMLEWVIADAGPIIKDTNVKMTRTRADVIGMKEKQDKTNQMLESLMVNFSLLQARGAANQELYEMLLQVKKDCQYLKEQQKREKREKRERAETGAIVTLAQLLGILFDLSFGQKRIDGQIDDPESMLEHLNDGLDTVVRRRIRVNIQDQSQAQTIFQDARFVSWLENEDPDVILVDGNMESASLDRVSAMSLFSANFVLGMTKLESQNICVHFFCGLHDSPMDPWHGPKGLLQSSIIQLLAALEARNRLNLDFLFERSQIKRLREGDINELCRVFHELVRQFSPETTVYCIIDSIQMFYHNTDSTDLELLVRHLKVVTRDEYLKPNFKVLMTVPFRSPTSLKKMVGKKAHVYLIARHLSPRGLTRRGFENNLSRGSTPSPRRRSRDAWEEPVESNSDFDSDETTEDWE
ncbi:hypothetical protein GQX73_g426 [Xylaria multiplex]|uniref:Uncharacterized protein n=1 Tax=Xylaria multiplex TaxID=323545 RepID=A0A7C8MZG6_9PEZI|nr:hypothetical protein GQX73_g426 [Xylaria multiplex]